MQADPDEGVETSGYEIDAAAVADAIVARLMAGRTIPGRPADDR